MQTKFGTLIYQGVQREIWLDDRQGIDFRYSRGQFWINQELSKNIEQINQVYNEFCKDKLDTIIKNGINRLRDKKITVTLDYTDGVKTFPKDVELSVDDYLSLTGYSKNIAYKIGQYTSEWGINAIDTKHKEFTLHFNLDLIKYDSGSKIDYVVAHELTHIFFRDHGERFNQALERLFPQKYAAESFFNVGIGRLFGGGGSNYTTLVALVGVSFLIYVAWMWVQQFFAGIFGSGAGASAIGGGAGF